MPCEVLLCSQGYEQCMGCAAHIVALGMKALGIAYQLNVLFQGLRIHYSSARANTSGRQTGGREQKASPINDSYTHPAGPATGFSSAVCGSPLVQHCIEEYVQGADILDDGAQKQQACQGVLHSVVRALNPYGSMQDYPN